MNDAPGDYAGFVTRAIAFAIDVALIDVAAAFVAIVVGLGISAFDLPDVVVTITIAAGGLAFLAWSAGYFATFWSTTGQTPGSRVMGVRVVCARGEEPVSLRCAIVRIAGMVLAALPLFAGFLLILVDDRRRGLQDRLARTVVVYASDLRRVS
jgi:uncharacterized RDD family membrane protein YckC